MTRAVTDVVERVARAIDPVAWKWIDATRVTEPDHLALPLTVARQMQQAEAAIKAMRSATVKMSFEGQRIIDAGDAAFPSDAVWQAMIDAALDDASPRRQG